MNFSSKPMNVKFPLTPIMTDRRFLLLVLCAAGFLVLFWSQTLNVPYWQDDYNFLLDAREARLAHKPWYSSFFPETKVGFWRPLGFGTYWRFVETVLGGNAQAAHVTNIVLLIFSAAAVGWFVSTLLDRLYPGKDSVTAGLGAAFLYGIHSSHFLPVAWAAAANDSICVLFSALTLRFWIVVSAANSRRDVLAAPLVVIFFVMALLSRDIAFVLPALGLLISLWLTSQYKPKVTAWVVGLLCIVIALVWLQLRNYFTSTVSEAYIFRFGVNIIRNTFCMVLFFFNTPFEALRYFFYVKASFGTALWGCSCFVLQVGAFGMMLRGAREQLGKKGIIILGAFFVIGCAPFFLLNVNCYPYYISIGLFVYAIIAGLAALRGRLVPAVLFFEVLSSTISTLGNYFLDSTSHIGRAVWAERQLVRLEAMRDVQPRLFSRPIPVLVEDDHKFQGFTSAGLAYRLGLEVDSIKVLTQGSQEEGKRAVLVVPKQGDVYFRKTGE